MGWIGIREKLEMREKIMSRPDWTALYCYDEIVRCTNDGSGGYVTGGGLGVTCPPQQAACTVYIVHWLLGSRKCAGKTTIVACPLLAFGKHIL